MKIKKALISILLSFAVILSLFSGCTSTEDKIIDSSDLPVSGQQGTATGEKNTIKIMTYRSCDSLDRYETNTEFGGHAQFMWGDALIFIDENNQYQPWLAEKWTTSDDFLEWTFTLRDDVYFHDGNKMTAEDVAFTYTRNLDEPDSNNSPITDITEAVEVIDERTVKFTFNAVNPAVYEIFYGYSVIEKAAYEADPTGYYKLPIGTGAYKITYYDSINGVLKFEKNESWWGWAATGTESNVDYIEVQYISEEATRINALRAGDVQIIDNVSPSNFGTLESEGLGYTVWDTLGMGLLMLNMNEGTVFHSDENLRQALSYCIDRQGIVDALRGGAGSAMDYSVQTNWTGYVGGTGVYNYDAEKAAQLVKNSDYDGRTLELIYRSSNESEIAQAIQAYANAVGISINITLVESSTFSEMLKGGNYDIALREWSGSCGENCKFYYEFLGYDYFNNGYGTIDPEFTELATSLQVLMDDGEIANAREQLFATMAEEYAPHIYLYTQYLVCAYAANISGVNYYPALNVDYRLLTVN